MFKDILAIYSENETKHIKITFFWYVTPYSLVARNIRFIEYLENVGSKFIHNVGRYIQDCTASYSRLQ
jgi:hypothetical protein